MQIRPRSKAASEGADTDAGHSARKEPQTAGSGSSIQARIRKILVPVDFSECATAALAYAVSFAGQLDASLVLLHIVEPAVGGETYLTLTPTLDDTNEHLVEAARERLQAVRQRHIGQQNSEILVRIGWAPSEIADTAQALGADLIILGTHGHSGLKHVLLGSTAEKVVRQAGCPVLTVRHTRE
jgi:universal stress protein A